ncbi:MAG TPA: lamin tail domain-containing protein, partial [Flavobacteriales bacterium]|nr:lamin tail domain-containing protein [Flavobacteriales bacterium]
MRPVPAPPLSLRGNLLSGLLIVTMLLTQVGARAQVTVFSENMGVPSGTTAIGTHDTNNGFQNSAAYVFTGTGDVRTTTASNNYGTASGGGNVFLTYGNTFMISGVSTTGYTGLGLAFGAYKNNSASDMTELLVEVSTDGTTWNTLTFPAQTSGSGTNVWRLLTISGGTIPATANLRIRWTNTETAGPQFRIDDVALTGFLPGGCGISLGSATITCLSNTGGVDSYTLTIPYAGSEAGVTVTNNSGSGAANSGDDPAVVSSGTLEFVGITEGMGYVIDFSAPCASLSLTGPSPSCEPLPDLVINEVHADPDPDFGDANGDAAVNTSQDEFVEIVNTGAAPVDVSGWTISDNFSVRHTFPSETVIAAGCAIVVFGGGVPTGTFGNAVVQTASTGLLGLNNTGDDVVLRDGSSTTIASFTYGGEGGDNVSLTRAPDLTGGFVVHSLATGSGGTLFSPGTMVDGSTFSGCAPPDPCPLADDGIPNFDENTCACELGYYATLEMVGMDEVITACTICPPGSFCADGINAAPCPAGRYQDQEGQTACIDCAEGSFNGAVGATSCQACPAGFFSNITGATACQACSAGTFNPITGASVCQDCPAGEYQPLEGQTVCLICEAGTFNATPGAISCQPCDAGYFSGSEGATECSACPPGSASNIVGASACALCPASTYNPFSAQTECLACPNGESSGVGATECTPDEECMDYILELQSGSTDPSSVTYHVLDETGTTTVLSGNNPVPANNIGTTTLCLPDGCYQLRVMDNAGDGLLGYVLRETGMNGRRLIDNSFNMIDGVSQIASGGTFCVPLGAVSPIWSSCDKLDWVN